MKDSFFYKAFIAMVLTIFMFSISSNYKVSYAAKLDRTPPSAPTYLKATSTTAVAITLSWTKSIDNVAVIAYDIYKNNALTASTSSTTFTVNNLTPGTTYSFYIKARDAKGNASLASNTISAKTISLTVASKKLVGHYSAWSTYSGFTPDKIDITKLTHINYAFANIGTDLKITMGYPDIDANNFKLLNNFKQVNPNLKTLISVGGWTWSGRFSDVALTDESRTAFADSCVAFITQYGFDGVDIDWEYPVSGGLSTNVKRAEDKQNFTLLLAKVREKLNSRGVLDDKKYLLTIAGGSSSTYVSNTELSQLQQYIDYANIMTYDIHGTWDSYTDLNAPLYTSSDSSPQYKWSVDASINAWIKAGFSLDKLVMGVPFYGYKYTMVNNTNNGLYQRFSGGGSVTYNTVASSYLNTSGYVRFYHSESMVPWLFNGSTFITYEDSQSIGAKASYIKSKGLAGAMAWELSEDSNGTLLNALYQGLK